MLNHPTLVFYSLLSTAVCKQSQGEREMLYCPSSVWTERADCEPNTVFASGKATLSVRLMSAHVHIQSPLGGVIFVVRTTSHLDDRAKHLNTLFCHILSLMPLSLAVVPLAWSRAWRIDCIFLMTQLGAFFVRQTGCSQPSCSAIHSFDLGFQWFKEHLDEKNTHASSKSSRYPSVIAPQWSSFPLSFVMDSCKPGCVGRQMQRLLTERVSSTLGAIQQRH